ncbi:ABC transporter permease [Timonella sp. A28]|uniref:ABC transporter permease n=1 Tax=Timonella sp. A28 TaxID=3442640 RepID=UPI003EBC5FEB
MSLRLNQRLKHDFIDVIIELHTRKSRAVMLMLAVALATGALVASLGISHVAARQVDADLAASTLNTVTVVPAMQDTQHDEEEKELIFPQDSVQRVKELGPIERVGLLNDVSLATSPRVTRAPHITDALTGVSVVAATSDYLFVLGDSIPEDLAWLLDSTHDVVFLGEDLAQKLAIPRDVNLTGINIELDGQPYSVAGFIDSPSGLFTSTVVLPYARGVDLAGGDGQAHMKILTEPGAGGPVATIVRTAIVPQAPESFTVSQVHSIDSLRAGVSTQLDKLAAFIGAFLLLLTILLIANAMTVSVMSRTGEIGVRRALGASQHSVARLFLFEGFIVGLCGGVAGSAVAALSVAAVSAVNQWSVSYSAFLLLLGPVVGVFAGLLSAAYPAYRAGNVQPAIAVRSD